MHINTLNNKRPEKSIYIKFADSKWDNPFFLNKKLKKQVYFVQELLR